MLRMIHRTVVHHDTSVSAGPFHTHALGADVPAWSRQYRGSEVPALGRVTHDVRTPAGPQPPIQLAIVGPVKALLRATGAINPRTHVRANKKVIAQPVKLTIDGAEHSIKTLEQAQSVASRLKIKSDNLQSQGSNYEQLAQVYRDKLSNPSANTAHLRAQIQNYEKLAAEHQRTSQLLDEQIRLLRETFKF